MVQVLPTELLIVDLGPLLGAAAALVTIVRLPVDGILNPSTTESLSRRRPTGCAIAPIAGDSWSKASKSWRRTIVD